MKAELIALNTRRYSEVLRRILTEYADGTSAEVDGRVYVSAEFSHLIEHWCTNASIRSTRNFTLRRGGAALFGFHDHPDELWACATELPFVERLAAEELLRYRVSPS